MTPKEIAANPALRLRFQNEVAYLDRMQPTESEVRNDTDLLNTSDGVLVIAWLWPHAEYGTDFDPFVGDSRASALLWENATRQSERIGVERALRNSSRAVDRRRQEQRELVAIRFARIVESTANEVGRDVEAVKRHLEWTVPLSGFEFDRLVRAEAPFPFALIARVCAALQLEFDSAWVLSDPHGLARRIDQSAVATEVSNRLHRLTEDNLRSVLRKLPRGSAELPVARQAEAFRAPGRGSRYASLYEALAADERTSPEYPLAEIDRILMKAGELVLPGSARDDRSWWTGTGARPEGRPQVSAWWAAGYRVRNVTIDPSNDRVMSVTFEALPGRPNWLKDQTRTLAREYRIPGPPRVNIYPGETLVRAPSNSSTTANPEVALRPSVAHRNRQIDEQILRSRGERSAERARMAAMLEARLRLGMSELADLERGLSEASQSAGRQARVKISMLESDLERLRARRNELLHLSDAPVASTPDDDDIRCLLDILDRHGEADRSQIERDFRSSRAESIDGAGLTNLLTKARRQGWTVNYGTRSQPRWATTRRMNALVVELAGMVNLAPPQLGSAATVPTEFFRQVAEAVGVTTGRDSATTQVARRVVMAAGGDWEAGYETSDLSLTSKGLEVLRDAIGKLAKPMTTVDVANLTGWAEL